MFPAISPEKHSYHNQNNIGNQPEIIGPFQGVGQLIEINFIEEVDQQRQRDGNSRNLA